MKAWQFLFASEAAGGNGSKSCINGKRGFLFFFFFLAGVFDL